MTSKDRGLWSTEGGAAGRRNLRAEPTLESADCDLCGKSGGRVVLEGGDFRYGLPGVFAVVRCDGCGLARLSPRPDASSLPNYYPDAYAPHRDPSSQHRNLAGAFLRRLGLGFGGPGNRALVWLYNCLAFRAFTARRPGRVLDVGCGTGAYLAIWKDLGWEVEGVEPNPHVATAAAESLRARVHCGFIEELELPAATFDLVTMSHSLEHMCSPRAVLRILRHLLVPGGELLLMVPNFSAWDRRLFSGDWYGLELPRHLYHFEPHTLAAVLRSEGFELCSLWGSAHPDVLVRSFRRWIGRGDLELPVGTMPRLLGTAALLLPAILKRSTSLWVLARRPAENGESHGSK